MPEILLLTADEILAMHEDEANYGGAAAVRAFYSRDVAREERWCPARIVATLEMFEFLKTVASKRLDDLLAAEARCRALEDERDALQDRLDDIRESARERD